MNNYILKGVVKYCTSGLSQQQENNLDKDGGAA